MKLAMKLTFIGLALAQLLATRTKFVSASPVSLVPTTAPTLTTANTSIIGATPVTVTVPPAVISESSLPPAIEYMQQHAERRSIQGLVTSDSKSTPTPAVSGDGQDNKSKRGLLKPRWDMYLIAQAGEPKNKGSLTKRYHFQMTAFSCDDVAFAVGTVIPSPLLYGATERNLQCYPDADGGDVWDFDITVPNGEGLDYLACALSWLQNPWAEFSITGGSCSHCKDNDILSNRQQSSTEAANGADSGTVCNNKPF